MKKILCVFILIFSFIGCCLKGFKLIENEKPQAFSIAREEPNLDETEGL